MLLASKACPTCVGQGNIKGNPCLYCENGIRNVTLNDLINVLGEGRFLEANQKISGVKAMRDFVASKGFWFTLSGASQTWDTIHQLVISASMNIENSQSSNNP